VHQQTLHAKLRAVTGITADDVSDSDLSLIISAALDEFLYYRPQTKVTAAAEAITTVASQPNYALPSDALWVIEVCWNPDQFSWEDTDGILDSLYLQLSAESFDAQHPSELYAVYQRYAEFRKFFQGHWRILNDEIWLIPPPYQAGDKVAVIYAAARTLSDLDAIKDNPFFQLCKGFLMERDAADALGNADWRAGSVAVGGAAALGKARSAERQLERARAICANNYYAEREGPGFAIPSQV